MILPSLTTTAPTGTSSAARALSARRNASCMNVSSISIWIIFFTNKCPDCELENVRWLLAFCTGFICIANAQAQHQEPGLVDRLLRPNMELQNKAQGKK